MEYLSKQLLKIVDSFVPVDILYGNSEELHLRARIFVSVLMSNIFLLLVVYILGGVVGEYSRYSIYIGACVVTIVLVLLVICLNTFKYTASFNVSGNLFAVTVFGALNCAVILTGGFYHSPTLPLFITLPICTYVICGRKAGLFWALLVSLNVIAYYIALENNIEVTQTLLMGHIRQFYLISILVICFISVAALFTFESLNTYYSNRLLIMKEQEEYESKRDARTGLSNILTFITEIEEMIAAADLKGSKFLIAIVSLQSPDSQAINPDEQDDIDSILILIANELKNDIADIDIISRYDEQSIALIIDPLKSMNDGNTVLEKIRTLIEKILVSKDRRYDTQIKIGAVVGPDNGNDAITLAYKAQHCLKEIIGTQEEIKIFSN